MIGSSGSALLRRSFALCSRCGSRAKQAGASASSGRGAFSTSSSTSNFNAAPVPQRSFIELEGRDTRKLLQGLMTNNVAALKIASRQPERQEARGLSLFNALHAGFLHPNGRLLADTLLYAVPNTSPSSPEGSDSDKVLIEVDSRVTEALLAYLRKFKLRSKVSLRVAAPDEWSVWQLWNADAGTALTRPAVDTVFAPASEVVQALETLAASGAHVRVDPRAPFLGCRVVVPGNVSVESQLNITPSESAYLVHRLLQGIPEGQDDILNGSSLPLEVNMDLNAGIDFKKGCYVGQELTARTHHTGVVRKRIVPLVYYPLDQSPPNKLTLDTSFPTLSHTWNIEVRAGDSLAGRRPRASGKLCGSTFHNLGLGLLRLASVETACHLPEGESDFRMRAIIGDGQGGPETEVGVRPFIPAAWDPRVVESTRVNAGPQSQ
ncbi:hypothetical protein V8E36_003065 [Tilletia maclaganii]